MEIGKGGFGRVYLAKEKKRDKEVIVKSIARERIMTKKYWDSKLKLPNEIAALQRLSHRNIVKLIRFYNNEDHLELVMEKHGDSVDLHHLSTSICHGGGSEFLWGFIFRQIVSAVSYMHSRNISHGDIKTKNVIVDQHFTAKLIDFGAARHRRDPHQPEWPFHFFVLTKAYAPPEIICRRSFTGFPQDVWQLGVLLFALLYKQVPFCSTEAIVSARLTFPAATQETRLYSEAHRSLLREILTRRVNQRLTVSQVEKHPWLLLCEEQRDKCSLDWDTVRDSRA